MIGFLALLLLVNVPAGLLGLAKPVLTFTP